MSRKAGFYLGRHYTEWVDEVRRLKRKEKFAKAEKLLLGLISATESEHKSEGAGWVLPPAYTEHLAIIYRKQRRYQDEIDILTRYIEFSSREEELGPNLFSARLDKAKLLLEKAGAQRVTPKASGSGCASLLVLTVGLIVVILVIG